MFLLRHVPSRWLTLQPAVQRILAQWDAFTKYFKELVNEDSSAKNNESYKAIMRLLVEPRTLVQLRFVADIASVFTSFLQLFQTEGPLIHRLFSAMGDLIRTLMLRFMNTEVVGLKNGADLKLLDVNDVNNLRSLTDIESGEPTRKALISIKEQHSMVLLDIRHFFTTCVMYLQQNLPLTNSVLEDVQCLDAIARTKPESEAMIRRLARKLPQVVCDDDVSAITDEWKLYAVDDIPGEWYSATVNATAVSSEWEYSETMSVPPVCRIDQYWSKVLDMTNAVGQLKYANLGKVVRACLALSHGNSDVERSFSVNKRIVTSDRASLSEDTINAIRLVKDAIRCHADGCAINVVVTPAMVNNARSAHAKYKQHLEEQKRLEEITRQIKIADKLRIDAEEQKKKEHEQSKKDLDELQKRQSVISSEEKEQRNLIHGAGVLLKEAEAKLSDAIKIGNMDQISVAHGLIEVARKRMDSATEELAKLAAKRKNCIDKQKRHLSFIEDRDDNEPKQKIYRRDIASSDIPRKKRTVITKKAMGPKHLLLLGRKHLQNRTICQLYHYKSN